MVIDASVWVAALLPRDAHHQDAARALHRLIEEGINVTTPLLALAEVAGAIARQTNDTAVAEKIVAFLRGQPWITFAPLAHELTTHAATIAAHHRLRGADAVYVALAAHYALPLLTLDREMLTRSNAIVQSLTPGTWLAQP